jgi:RNA polymerase sigma factor (sigma-70 family)
MFIARPLLPPAGGVRQPAAAIGCDAVAPRVEPAAFEELYSAAFPKVYAFIRSQVATTEAAQELVSRVFLKAYRHREKAPRGGAAMQWVFRIAHTTLIDYWRVEKRHERASLPIHEIAELPAASTDPETAYERKRQIGDLLQVVSDLGEEDRAMLSLKFAAHRTNRDIAGILHVSEGAVSMRLLRSLRRLRERLERMGWQ